MITNLYVIIVTYNGIQWINDCLLSCKGFKILVVDNNSTDDTVSFIKNEFPNVEVFPQEKNLGFGAANNLGMSHALKNNADYVFLLNQDAYLQFDTISKLIEFYKENSEYGLISPIHLNGNANKLDKGFSNYIKTNEELLYDVLKGMFLKPVYEVPFVNAAAWLLPKKTLEVVGGFDPIFFHYAEDFNYCQRLQYHGFKIGVVPKCYIQHDREFRSRNSNNSYNLILRERLLKRKWANINIEVSEEIERYNKHIKKLIFKLFFKFQYKKLLYYKRELALIKRITPQIFKSRNINSKKGNHYLQ